MGVMPAMEFCDRFAVNVASAGSNENSLLKLSFEHSLQRNKECRSVVAVPVCITARSDFGVINLHLDLRIPGQRGDKSVQKDIPVQVLSRAGVTRQSEFEVVQCVICNHSLSPSGNEELASIEIRPAEVCPMEDESEAPAEVQVKSG
jgi:hypothetical protein